MISFTDVIQPSQIKQHLLVPFQVPSGIRQIDIKFDYEPHKVEGRNNLLTLTLFDSHQVRGEGHKMQPQQQVTISPTMATPGYVAGELPSGEWTVAINTHMVLAPVTYRLQIQLSTQETATATQNLPVGSTAGRGSGWYRGDLHGHTIHSDGSWDVPDLVAYARSQGLDFVTLTDHNTISGLAQIASLSADDLLTMGGMELTTYYGHVLALGVRDWIDWRVQTGVRTMSDILQEVEQHRGLFVIAHPMSLGDPICTGCDWQYADVMPGQARCIEIWNTTWDEPDSRNELALQLWYRWLNERYRMVATTGSDIHHKPRSNTKYGRDTVYAQELSERAILNAVRQGHLYLSVGPRLDLQATTADGQTAMMGDCVHASTAHLKISWADVPAESALRWIVDGEVKQELRCDKDGSTDLECVAGRWSLFELRDSANRMLAVTNPVFFGADWC
jgi:hypothetical protein